MTLSLDLDIGACLSYQLWILYCFFEKWKWHQKSSDGNASPIPKSKAWPCSEGRSWENTPFSPEALYVHVSVSPTFLERNFLLAVHKPGNKDKRTNKWNKLLNCEKQGELLRGGTVWDEAKNQPGLRPSGALSPPRYWIRWVAEK